MLMTKRKPASVGEILVQEFMEPMGLTQGVLAKAMGVPRKHVNELCNNRRAVTAPTATQRLVGGDALAARVRADQTRPPDRNGCVSPHSLTFIRE